MLSYFSVLIKVFVSFFHFETKHNNKMARKNSVISNICLQDAKTHPMFAKRMIKKFIGQTNSIFAPKTCHIISW